MYCMYCVKIGSCGKTAEVAHLHNVPLQSKQGLTVLGGRIPAKGASVFARGMIEVFDRAAREEMAKPI